MHVRTFEHVKNYVVKYNKSLFKHFTATHYECPSEINRKLHNRRHMIVWARWFSLLILQVKCLLLIPFEKVVHYTKSGRGVVALCANNTESAIRFQLCGLSGEIWGFCAEFPRKKYSDLGCILPVLPK